jgi:hypothetical protein
MGIDGPMRLREVRVRNGLDTAPALRHGMTQGAARVRNRPPDEAGMQRAGETLENHRRGVRSFTTGDARAALLQGLQAGLTSSASCVVRRRRFVPSAEML